MISLAQGFRDFRYSKGWGPDELANRAEISRTALYQIESGKTGLPRAGTLRRIAVALDVSMDDLLGNTEAASHHGPAHPHAAGRFSSSSDPALAPSRPRELADWIPSEGGPLNLPAHPHYATHAHAPSRDEARGDEQRPGMDSPK